MALELAGTRRLIITDMVLENFKSYAGEQHVGPFHKVSQACSVLWISVLVDVTQIG